MAERRMFAKTIIDSDAFIDMPVTARLLYYDLSMRADDDGFVNSPKKIMRMVGASQDDLTILITKKFIIPFESGVVVIKHWKIHNYIQNDRHKPTTYQDELAQLELDENKAYRLPVNGMDTNRIQNGYRLDTQVRIGKDRDRLGKDSTDNMFKSDDVEQANEQDELFKKFWNLYPRKQGKQTAMKAFNKVCKNEEAYLLIEAGLLRVIPEWKKDDPKYTPLPATWLNGRRWEDEPLTPAAGQSILELLNEFDKEEEEEPHEDE